MTTEKEEWITRCKAQFVKRAALDDGQAQVCAEVAYDNEEDFNLYTPEESADNEMDCWDDDGE